MCESTIKITKLAYSPHNVGETEGKSSYPPVEKIQWGLEKVNEILGTVLQLVPTKEVE